MFDVFLSRRKTYKRIHFTKSGQNKIDILELINRNKKMNTNFAPVNSTLLQTIVFDQFVINSLTLMYSELYFCNTYGVLLKQWMQNVSNNVMIGVFVCWLVATTFFLLWHIVLTCTILIFHRDDILPKEGLDEA